MDDDGRFSGYTDKTKLYLLKMMSDHWQVLSTKKVINKTEMELASWPFIHRTSADVIKPFMNPNSHVSKSGLKLVHQEQTCYWHSNINTVKIIGEKGTDVNSHMFTCCHSGRTHV